MMLLRMVAVLLAVSVASGASPRANAHVAQRIAPEAMLAMADAPEPMFTTSTMPKVSPAVYCVIVFSAMYFVLFTVLAIVRTAKTFKKTDTLVKMESIFKTGTDTMMYAPMLCALFLGARMRGIQLAQGETEKYKLPQPWVQLAMLSTLVSVFFQVVIVLLMPVFTNEAKVEDGEMDLSAMQKGSIAATVLTVIRYTLMLMLYGGFTAVIVGIFMMEGPEEIWQGKQPPVSPAVFTTVLLTTLFFTAYLGVAVLKTVKELTSICWPALENAFEQAKSTVNMAPMLCILFIGARMRALQMDPKNGNPQRWAQMCFYVCAGSVAIQFFLVVLSPFLPGVEFVESKVANKVDGDIAFASDNASVQMCLTALRYAALLGLYGGSSAVMFSVFTIEHPTDVSLTPPISPAMQCVMNLTVQYFSVYLAYFVCVTISQFKPDLEFVKLRLVPILEGAKSTVAFAPMLSMLFIGARMRALQLTKATDGTIPPTAGPQPWAQQGMFLASWSVLVQVILTIVVPLFVGDKPEFDENNMLKTPTSPPGGKIVGYVLEALRYFCLLAMYGGATLVVVAVFQMTPETLQPYASMAPLVPGAEVGGVKTPGVEVPAPPTPPTPHF